ncbi:glyoxalase-like protein [Bacillus oleivorans]|uniref:Glyoxalase-like protein n=1 Tax=Bacillus oleivorans TaxID=1448271 RepID=A0A285CU43_9BACI|nr:VOC family protein [Bacillus oleivorans]SNX70473.1 glyoxalase-like protein [Bacillus oleivorans]
MDLFLDHLVQFVYKDLDSKTEMLNKEGIPVKRGGSHVDWGTYNSLLYSPNLTYIEWLAIEDREIAEKAENPLVHHLLKKASAGDHLGQIALRTYNMDEIARGFSEKNIPHQLFDGRRTRSDGVTLTWKMLFLKQKAGTMELPFLIEWGQTDTERKNDLEKQGLIDHNLSISKVYYAVHNAAASLNKWYYFFPFEEKKVVTKEDWFGKGFEIQLKNAALVFLQPVKNGYISDILNRYGEGPFLFE